MFVVNARAVLCFVFSFLFVLLLGPVDSRGSLVYRLNDRTTVTIEGGYSFNLQKPFPSKIKIDDKDILAIGGEGLGKNFNGETFLKVKGGKVITKGNGIGPFNIAANVLGKRKADLTALYEEYFNGRLLKIYPMADISMRVTFEFDLYRSNYEEEFFDDDFYNLSYKGIFGLGQNNGSISFNSSYFAFDSSYFGQFWFASDVYGIYNTDSIKPFQPGPVSFYTLGPFSFIGLPRVSEYSSGDDFFPYTILHYVLLNSNGLADCKTVAEERMCNAIFGSSQGGRSIYWNYFHPAVHGTDKELVPSFFNSWRLTYISPEMYGFKFLLSYTPSVQNSGFLSSLFNPSYEKRLGASLKILRFEAKYSFEFLLPILNIGNNSVDLLNTLSFFFRYGKKYRGNNPFTSLGDIFSTNAEQYFSVLLENEVFSLGFFVRRNSACLYDTLILFNEAVPRLGGSGNVNSGSLASGVSYTSTLGGGASANLDDFSSSLAYSCSSSSNHFPGVVAGDSEYKTNYTFRLGGKAALDYFGFEGLSVAASVSYIRNHYSKNVIVELVPRSGRVANKLEGKDGPVGYFTDRKYMNDPMAIIVDVGLNYEFSDNLSYHFLIQAGKDWGINYLINKGSTEGYHSVRRSLPSLRSFVFGLELGITYSL